MLDCDQIGLCLVYFVLLFLLALYGFKFGAAVRLLPLDPNGLRAFVVSLRDGRKMPPSADGYDYSHKSASPAYELPEGKESGHCCAVTFVVVSFCWTADWATTSLPLFLSSQIPPNT